MVVPEYDVRSTASAGRQVRSSVTKPVKDQMLPTIPSLWAEWGVHSHQAASLWGAAAEGCLANWRLVHQPAPQAQQLPAAWEKQSCPPTPPLSRLFGCCSLVASGASPRRKGRRWRLAHRWARKAVEQVVRPCHPPPMAPHVVDLVTTQPSDIIHCSGSPEQPLLVFASEGRPLPCHLPGLMACRPSPSLPCGSTGHS